MKDKPYISLAYMTGILPVKKYGNHSARNMFTEYSMTNPKRMGEYMGFTSDEVEKLCARYQMSFEDVKAWYDGYSFEGISSVYSPKSVAECLTNGIFDNYWNQTETFEALKVYIQMNYDRGTKEHISVLLKQQSNRAVTQPSLHGKDVLERKGFTAYEAEQRG